MAEKNKDKAIIGGLIGGGTALSIFGSIHSGLAKSNAAMENSLWLEEQAAFIQEATNREYELAKQDQELVIGQQYGAYAMAGVDLSGSALDTINESFSRASLELEAIRRNGEMQVREASLKANAERNAAGDYKLAGYLGAASSLLSGGASYYKSTRGNYA